MSPFPGYPPTPVIPNAERAAVEWARAEPRLSALLEAGDLSTRQPIQPKRYPYLTVYEVPGSGPDSSQVPISWSLMRWDARSLRQRRGETIPDYNGALLVATTLVAALMDISAEPIRDEAGLVIGFIADAVVTDGPGRMPEVDGLAAYRVDSILAIQPA